MTDKITLRVLGLGRVQTAMLRVPVNVRAGARKGVIAAARIVESYAKQKVLKGPATGRVYKRGTIAHQASAPGEFPASDTGTLVRSINSEVDEEGLAANVGSNTNYARALELQPESKGGRPFLLPALTDKASEARSAFAAFIRAELKK